MHVVGFNCNSCITMHGTNNIKKTTVFVPHGRSASETEIITF